MTRRAVVIGTGGHARTVLSLLRDVEGHQILHIVELGQPRLDERIMAHPASATPNVLPSLAGQPDIDVFLAIGNNATRRYWWERITLMGLPLPNLISPRAFVDPSATLGEANVVCSCAYIGPEARLGSNNLINTRATVEHEVVVGNHCHLAPSSTIAGRSCVGHSCFLGAGSVVIDNISVADGTVLGAGAVLVDRIAAGGRTFVGVPARAVGEQA